MKGGRQTLEDFGLHAVSDESALRDLPRAALEGKLGEICSTRMSRFPRAYAWPALLAAASARIDLRAPNVRTNVYCALVGKVHTGKSQAIEHANAILGVESPVLLETMAGSGEALAKRIADAAGNPRLLSPDELGHLLEKMQIERASFSYLLNSAFYKNRVDVRMGKGLTAQFDCALSIVGGLVEEKFQDLFTATSTSELYDRFLFGLAPDGFDYDYYPFKGPREDIAPSVVSIDRSVWDEVAEWKAADAELNPRVAEIAIRAATICAAIDGQKVLYGANLEAAKELVAYQTRVRRRLKPNPGLNFEARLAHKFLTYLADKKGWVSRRTMFRETHAYDLGPSIADRALDTLHANGDVEIVKQGRRTMVRLADEEREE